MAGQTEALELAAKKAILAHRRGADWETTTKELVKAFLAAGYVKLAGDHELPPTPNTYWANTIISYAQAQQDMLVPVPIGNNRQARWVKIEEEIPEVKTDGTK